ncbi:MAG: lipoate--protein ligase [bacterium]
MTKKIRVLFSDTHNPWFNLATEDWIFRDMDPDTAVLYLWRNQETVVIGRFQNPWIECNTSKMEADNILLTRRQSGGGAVFHDLGNTNFTFLNGKAHYDKARNNKIITNAIAHFDIKAYASGRNDILVDGSDGARKISGSAFKETKDRSFHHGTLLINANLGKLANYLQPDEKKLVSKGIKSVRARVANLTDFNPKITHEALCHQIVQEFFKEYGQECEIEHLDDAWLKTIKPLNDYYENLKDWKWRFGETPKFNHHMSARFDWGGMDIHLDVHKGVITAATIFSDSLHPEMIESLAQAFKDQEYTKAGISGVITKVALELPMIKDYLVELNDWMSPQIS